MKKAAPTDLDWSSRLAFAVSGFLAIAYGYGKILAGKPIYENWRGLDVTAYFVIFLGGFFLFVAISPWGRIRFLWDTDRKKRHR